MKLTLGRCAQQLGVDLKTLFNWERGKHRPLKSMEERIKSFLG